MKFRPTNNRPDTAAFTMVEIAICLAIIGFALVAIIGVLPIGMNTQRDNREETIINQDATVLLEAVRNGTHGANDLTNYVYAIVNTGSRPVGYINPLLAGAMNFSKAAFPSMPWYSILTNGANIIGLLSTPEYVDQYGQPIPNLSYATPSYNNHIVAYVRSLSGLAAEKPPQNNAIMVADTFSYCIFCVNAPVPVDTNIFNLPLAQRQYVRQLSVNLHELRMTFLWPLLPNGQFPPRPPRQTFRATIAGQLLPDRNNNNNLYFYQSQSFTNAP